MTDVQQPAAADSAQPSVQPSARELVERFGMTRAGARPSLVRYAKDLWARRYFIVNYTRAANSATYTHSFLGQLWQLLTPLLNVLVYFLIFGVLLKTSRGTHNFIAFLTVGLFVFSFLQQSIVSASRSITNNHGLIRALHFPRASLPLGTTAIAFQQLLTSMVVLLPIVLITGEPVQASWALILPALLLESVFALGMAFVFARLGARIPDTSQLLPFLMRTWLYTSGIFYSVQAFTRGRPGWVEVLLEANPGGVYPELARHALLEGHTLTPHAWLYGTLWAVGAFTFGLVFFWQGEESYGRG